MRESTQNGLEAYALISECIEGRNRDDFLDEFYSYWNPDATGPTLWSLVTPQPPSRFLAFVRGDRYTVLGESAASLNHWLDNRYGPREGRIVEQGALLWLERPLFPSEYPKTVKDLWNIADRAGGCALLSELVSPSPNATFLLLGSMTSNGPSLGGVLIPRPSATDVRGRNLNTLNKGFRPGKVPRAVLATRYFGGTTTASRCRTDRADGPWIHGRDHNNEIPILEKAKVALLGCGSLGAPAAIQLASSGVGSLLLIDRESLKWANLGRHPLGAPYIDVPKAAGLAKELRSRFPHLLVESIDSSWEEALRENPNLLEECDLIVSAIGSWNAEDSLNSWHVEHGREPTVLYCWTEPFAIAGHAVAIQGPACLQCHFDKQGKFEYEATMWPTRGKFREPACGITYQPYGPSELSFILAMASAAALDYLTKRVSGSGHRLWLGSDRVLREAGGTWSKRILDDYPARNLDGGLYHRSWEAKLDCLACGRPKEPQV
jgi:sulfur-carrier protein adenylyltransferase/sulfurtransferase